MTRRHLAAGIGVLVFLLTIAYLGASMERRSRVRFPSSYAGEPEGLLAFRRLLEGSAIPTRVRSLPWDGLRSEAPDGVLIVATPIQRDIDDREMDAVHDWLMRGGAMLVVDDATDIEPSPRLDLLLEESGLASRAPAPRLNPGTFFPERPRTLAARGTPAVPAGRDLKRLMLHADGGLLPQSGAVPLALSPAKEVVAAEGALGSGRVVLVLGALLANDALLQGDDLTFALRLIEDLRGGGPVLFDEYHHGFGGVLPTIRGLNRAALAWAAAQALFAAALYAAARGTRFGPARPPRESSRRSSLEFVRSMAALYRRARARQHVLETLRSRFVHRVRSRIEPAAGPDSSGAELVELCERRSGVPRERIQAALDRVEEAILTPALSDRTLRDRAVDLDRLEEEVLGGSRSGS